MAFAGLKKQINKANQVSFFYLLIDLMYKCCIILKTRSTIKALIRIIYYVKECELFSNLLLCKILFSVTCDPIVFLFICFMFYILLLRRC